MQLDPRDVREATELTVKRSAQQLELQLGHLCNNRCVFCCSGQLSELGVAKQIAIEPVLAALDAAASRGVRKVTILGGEPTSQKSFFPALRRAVELGFEEIVIFTNGVTSSNRAFVERVVEIGRFTWRFSIQGGTEEAHDAVTKVPGSFRRIVAGMTHLRDLGQRITANMCVNELSYRSLPHYPALVREFGIGDLHIDMVRPAQAGKRTDEWLRSLLLPRFSAMAPYVREMLERFDEFDPAFDVNVGNFPYCLLPEWTHKIHHGGDLTALETPDANGGMQPVDDKYGVQWSAMVYGPDCDRCALRAECRGVPREYAAFYGFDELQPLTTRSVQGQTRDGRFFVLAMDEILAPAIAANAPAPWHTARVSRHTRDGMIEMIFEAGPTMAIVSFRRPGSELDAGSRRLWETHHYQVALRSASGTQNVQELVSWLHRVLRIPLQTRIATCVDRIRTAGLVGGWHYAGSRADVESLAVTALIDSAEGTRIGVTVAPGDAGDAPVRVTFDVGALDPLVARPVVQTLSAALTR